MELDDDGKRYRGAVIKYTESHLLSVQGDYVGPVSWGLWMRYRTVGSQVRHGAVSSYLTWTLPHRLRAESQPEE